MHTNIDLEPFKDLLDNLQVVVLDCPYDSLQDADSQKMFGKYIGLKLNGFMAEYPHGALPLGTYDFIGTVVMICEKTKFGLNPITCFKSTTVDRAEYFSLPFEVNGLFRGDGDEDHANYVRQVIAELPKTGRRLGYNSSWTMDSKWGRGTPARKLLLDMSLACLVNYYQAFQIDEIVSAAVLRFKIDGVQTFLGFEHLEKDGVRLPPMKAWFVKDEPTALMHLKQFAPDAITLGKQFKFLWDARLTIGVDHNQESAKKAA